MRRLALLLALTLVGCAGSFGEARQAGRSAHELGAAAPTATPERCASLDDRRITYGAIAKASAVLAGASGVSTVPIGDDDEAHERAQIAVAGVGVGFAAIAAGAMFISEGAGESWVRECSDQHSSSP